MRSLICWSPSRSLSRQTPSSVISSLSNSREQIEPAAALNQVHHPLPTTDWWQGVCVCMWQGVIECVCVCVGQGVSECMCVCTSTPAVQPQVSTVIFSLDLNIHDYKHFHDTARVKKMDIRIYTVLLDHVSC